MNTPYPVGSLARDSSGNLYGVTTQAGNSGGLGVIYKLSIAANNYFNFSVLAKFTAATGGVPAGGLYVDSNGNLFGTTTTDAVGSNGTIFELDTAGTLTTLATFDSATTGATPTGSLVADASGNLFGETAAGGANSDGTIFELPKTSAGFGTLRAVASFSGTDNSNTRNGLTIGADGTLYGVGDFANDVFKAGPSDSYVIHQIATITAPDTVPFLDGNGNLYGGTIGGAIYQINLSTNAVTTSTASGQFVEAVLADSSGNVTFTTENGLYELAAGATTPTQLADGDLSALVTDGAGNYFSISRFGGGSGEFFEYGPTVSNIVYGLDFQPGAMYTPIDAVAGQVAPAAIVTASGDVSQAVPNVEPICTVSIKTGPTGGVLGGTLTRQAVNGVATFSDLTFSLPGDYEIVVADANGDAGFTALYHVTASGGGGGGGGGGITTGGAITPSVTTSTIPSSVVAGAKLHSSVKVLLTDASATAAVKGKTTVAIYASTSGSVDSSAVLINSATIKSLSLKASGSKSATVPVKSLPSALADGTYSLIAQVTDPTGAVSVSSAGNAVTVAAPFVSLSVSIATVRNAALVPGKPTPLIITLNNAGNVDAVGAAMITLAINADGVAAAVGGPLKKQLKVKAGKSLIVHVTLKTPKMQSGSVLSPEVTVALSGETVTTIVPVTTAVNGGGALEGGFDYTSIYLGNW